LGRLAAHLPGVFNRLVTPAERSAETIEQIVERRVDLLTRYQNTEYAARYSKFISKVVSRMGAFSGDDAKALSVEVAISLARLMSYKDEYEVARLFSAPQFDEHLQRQFSGKLRLKYHMAPPGLARTRKGRDRPDKIAFGPWVRVVFRVLARMKFLRGTWFDPF